MTKSRQKDQLLYGLLAVVFTAVAVLMSGNILKTEITRQSAPTTAQISENAQTPDDLMQELQKTVDDGGSSDIQQIESEASGL